MSGAIVVIREIKPKRKNQPSKNAGRPRAHIVLFSFKTDLDMFSIRENFRHSNRISFNIKPIAIHEELKTRLVTDKTTSLPFTAKYVVQKMLNCLKGATVQELKPLLQPACLQFMGKNSSRI